MRITVIGCSGSFPGPDGPSSCYLLEAEGFRLLLDLGSGAVGALQRHASLDDIDAVCLSHHHADHCLDMCPFWVARSYDPHRRYRQIPVYGPAGTARRMAQAYGMDEDPGMTEVFDFVTLTPGKREIGPFQITLAHMNHPVETFGFRVEHAGRVVAYSADTGACPALFQLASQADVLLCEASYLSGPDPLPDIHLTARQAAEHAARAETGQLVLTHLVPWNPQERTLAEAQEFSSFGGVISLAAPGRIIDMD